LKLDRRYRDKGFAVLDWRTISVARPGANKQIAVCRVNYGITFPMFAKTSVVANANPLYRALAARTGKPPVEFSKYLLDRPAAGSRVRAPSSRDPRLTAQIEKLLLRAMQQSFKSFQRFLWFQSFQQFKSR
jgi:glutathione peroxidase